MATKKTATGTRLKNYLSASSESAIFEAIRKTLASHGAKRISFDYDADGNATAIQFSIEINTETMIFRLPARTENVERLVEQSWRSAGRGRITGEALKQQAARTAWANIRDWVAAQMAMVDTGMTRTEEIFLPYLMVDEGKTFYEAFAEQRALPAAPNFIMIEE